MSIESNQIYHVGEVAHDLSRRADPVLRALGQHMLDLYGVLDMVRRLDNANEDAETVRQAIWTLLPSSTMAESLIQDARELAALLSRVVRVEDGLKGDGHGH